MLTSANHLLIEIISTLTEQSKIPINFEGKYKWIVFLPSKMHPSIGVLNRYCGVMESGKIKVRGIEVRKRDTPKFIFNAQTDIINELAKANNTKELYQRIPKALEVVGLYRQKLLDQEIPIWDLLIKKHLSKKPQHYRQNVSQVIAARQILQDGGEVHAGGSIKFVFTSAENKRVNRRVKAGEFVEDKTNPDIQRYLKLLYDSTANILSFAGYTPQTVYEAVSGRKQKQLPNFQGAE